MRKKENFIYKENKKLQGILSFAVEKESIKIEFICALQPRRGIGRQLLQKLADFAVKNNIKTIRSTVSSEDQRALAYKASGFTTYAEFYLRKDFLLYRVKARAIQGIEN